MAPTASAAYKARTVKDLQAELAAEGLSTKGTKAVLWDRLAAHLAGAAGEHLDAEEESVSENEPPPPQQQQQQQQVPALVSLATTTSSQATPVQLPMSPPSPVAPASSSAVPAAGPTPAAAPSTTATVALAAAPPTLIVPTPPLIVQMAPPPPPPPADIRHLYVRCGGRAMETIVFDCNDKLACDQVTALLRNLVPPRGMAAIKEPETEIVYLVDSLGELQPITPAFLSQCPTPNDPADSVFIVRTRAIVGVTLPRHRLVLAMVFSAWEILLVSVFFYACNLLLGTSLSVFDQVFLFPRLGLGAFFTLARSLLGLSRIDGVLGLFAYLLSWLVTSAWTSRAYRINLVWWLPRLRAQVTDIARSLSRVRRGGVVARDAVALPRPLGPWALRARRILNWLQVALPWAVRRGIVKSAWVTIVFSLVLPESPKIGIVGLIGILFLAPLGRIPDETPLAFLRRMAFESLGLGEPEEAPPSAPTGLRVVGSTSDSVALEWISSSPRFHVALGPGLACFASRRSPSVPLPWTWTILLLVAVLRSHSIVASVLVGLTVLALQAPSLQPSPVRVTVRDLKSDCDLAVTVTPIDALGRPGPVATVQARTKPALLARRLIAAYADGDEDLRICSVGVHLAEPTRGSEQADCDAVLRTIRAAFVPAPRSNKLEPDVVLSLGQQLHRVFGPAYLKALTQTKDGSSWSAPLVVVHNPGTRLPAIARLFPWPNFVTRILVTGFLVVFVVAQIDDFINGPEDWWTVDLPRALQTMVQTVLLGNAFAAMSDIAIKLGALARAGHSVADALRPLVLRAAAAARDEILPGGAEVHPLWARRVFLLGAALLLAATAWLLLGWLSFLAFSGFLAWATRVAWEAEP